MQTLIKLIIAILLLQIVKPFNIRKEEQIVQNPMFKIFGQMISQNDEETCYGVIFDAGSSGTRVYVYKWPCREIQTMSFINIKEMSPQKKKNPGIATFSTHIEDIAGYLQELVTFAQANVPPKLWGYTPIFLGATAGMRVLEQADQDKIMQKVRNILQESGFLFIDPTWARVITGQEEVFQNQKIIYQGAYMWMSINYLLNLLDQKVSPDQTILTIDLGGASTQISYKPLSPTQNKTSDIDIVIPNFNQYEIYAISHLGYGNDLARNNILASIVRVDPKIMVTPCYHSGFKSTWDLDETVQIQGTGKYLECQALIRQYMNNDPSACPFDDGQCGINQNYQPKIDQKMNVYAVSGATVAASFLGFLNDFKQQEFYDKGVLFWQSTWEQVLSNPDWASNPYTATNYFLTLYTYELLSYGYKIPSNNIIHAPSLISDNTPSWTLAGMFYQLSQIECQYDSPVCNTGINSVTFNL